MVCKRVFSNFWGVESKEPKTALPKEQEKL